MTTTPAITAVLCTFNRADRVERAVRAILAQQDADFELVVVDDGSTDATPEVLAGIDHLRLRVVRRPNGGLSRARNTGLAEARGRWVVFIDDDDLAEPGWLATLLAQAAEPDVGIACCGATFVDAKDEVLFLHSPHPFGEPFGSARGSYLAGTFAARTDLLRRAGGYLDGLGTRHQSELFMRLLAVAGAEGLRMVSVDAHLVRIEARPATERPGVNPRRLYDGARWILARHGEMFAGQHTAIARYEGVIGTNAARLGDWRAARRRFLRSALASRRHPQPWARLALASVPSVGRRVWNRHGTFATHDITEIGVPRQDGAGDAGGHRELFLAWGYRERLTPEPAPGDRPDPPAPVGAARAAVAEPAALRAGGPAHRLAARVAARHGWSPVVVVGDDVGTGDRTLDASDAPGLTVCTDLVQRVDDPVALLHRVAEIAAGSPVIVSTPDRAVADPGRVGGPPTDPRHRREWTHDQFELLLLSAGFDVVRSWHVRPDRRAGAGAGPEARRRLRRRRSCMVFLVRSRATAGSGSGTAGR